MPPLVLKQRTCKNNMTKQQVFAVILTVLFIDQCSKIYIKTHFELGQTLVIFNWFKILFVENDGMAWGAKISDLNHFYTINKLRCFLKNL